MKGSGEATDSRGMRSLTHLNGLPFPNPPRWARLLTTPSAQCKARVKQSTEDHGGYLFKLAIKSSRVMAAMVRVCSVPRAPSSIATRQMVSLSGASRMLQKS